MMPIYIVTDPQTGQKVKLTGDSPPTEQELNGIFEGLAATTQPAIGDQAQPEPSLGQQFEGVGENIDTLVAGAILEPIAGIAGIAQTLNPFADEGAGARAVKAVKDFGFKPKTETGIKQQKAIGETLKPIGEALKTAESFLGEETLELTGSQALAAVAHTLPTAALELLGLGVSKKLTKVKAPSDKLVKKTLIESAPDVTKIKNASRAIFKELDESGVSIKQEALKRLESNLDEIAKKQGIRERVTPEAFGAISEVKKDIALGKSLSISQMDELRTIAKNSIVPSDANKARVGARIVDEIDSFLDDIKSVDIEKGAQVTASNVGKQYQAARKLWGRAKRSEMLTDAIEMGASRKAGVEKGIRNELNNLLNRKKSRKFLSKEDVIAIRKVTDGDFKQNFASLVGGMGLKLENSPSLFSSMVGGGGAGALASTVPGLAGSVAPVAIGAITVGTIAKEVAKKITRNRAGFLDTITRAGKDGERIAKAYLTAVPKSKRRVSDLSDLLLDADINLGSLEKAGNDLIQDAVKAARFKRELLQASTTSVVAGVSSAKDRVDDNER
jgi:hypothetical protein